MLTLDDLDTPTAIGTGGAARAPGLLSRHSSAITAARSSTKCAARIGVGSAVGAASVQNGGWRPVAAVVAIPLAPKATTDCLGSDSSLASTHGFPIRPERSDSSKNDRDITN